MKVSTINSAVHPGSQSKLRKKAQVVLEEETQIIYAITQHSQTLDAHAKGESRVALRIDPGHFEHPGVDHSATHNLEPPGMATNPAAVATAMYALNIDLSARLYKREVGRAKTNSEFFFEKHLQELLNQPFEIRKARVLVD